MSGSFNEPVSEELLLMQRDQLGQFIAGRKLRAVTHDERTQILAISQRWQDELKDLDEVLEAMEGIAQGLGDSALFEGIRKERNDLRTLELETLKRLESDAERAEIRDAYAETDAGDGPMFYESNNVDRLDVTGLEGKVASALALRLKAWNPHAKKVYSRRNGGKRYLTNQVHRIDLNDPIISGLPGRDDLLETARDQGETFVYEDVGSATAAKRLSSAEISRQARLRKQSQTEQNGLDMTVEYSVGGATQGGLGV